MGVLGAGHRRRRELAWLGITRPGARSAIDRMKVWTLVPVLRMFIADWFVTEDHARDSGLWVHDNIHIGEACDLVGEVPEVSKEDLDLFPLVRLRR